VSEDGTWTIPKEEREKGNAGIIKLPRIAFEVIEAQPRIADNPYIFPGPRGEGPFNAFGKYKAELDAKLGFPEPWVVHDLRRTARSLMAKAGVADNIAERVLGHVISGVHGVYNRHDYTDEKADALTKLAALIENIIHPPTDNVVAFAAGR
jgi:integrase